MTAAWILVVEDEPLLGELITENLREEGYAAEHVSDGASALERLDRGGVDLVILDLMLPKVPGLDVLKQLRKRQDSVPVLILSALSSEEQRIQGLRLGADDYLGKPFSLRELLLRVAALLRRTKAPVAAPPHTITFGGNEIDIDTYFARTFSGIEHKLTQKEAMLLRFLAGNANRVVSRTEILDAVWGRAAFPTERTIDNFIARFRKLFERDPRHPTHFHTLRGVGYRFEP